MIEKKPFEFPGAAERKKRLKKLLPEFIKEHKSEFDSPELFKQEIKTLVNITIDKEAFAEYMTRDKSAEKLKDACRFISSKTLDKEGAVRELQNELVNGLLRRWKTNSAKFLNEEDPQEYATESREGKFILETLHALLETNLLTLVVKAKKKDSRIAEIPTENLMGAAYNLFLRCVFAYQEKGAHFKTYLRSAFDHFGEDYVSRHEKEWKIRAFSDLERSEDENPFRFQDHHADHREKSAAENARTNELTSAVRELIEGLETPAAKGKQKVNPPNKEIMQIYLMEGKEAAAAFVEKNYGISSHDSRVYVKRALRAFQIAAEKDPRFNDIASKDKGR